MGVSQVVWWRRTKKPLVAFQSIEQAGVSDSVEIICKTVDDSLDVTGADLIIPILLGALKSKIRSAFSRSNNSFKCYFTSDA